MFVFDSGDLFYICVLLILGLFWPLVLFSKWLKFKFRNRCPSCLYDYPDCPARIGDITFGGGRGKDNVYKCKKYAKKN